MAQGMVGALGVRLPVALLVSRAADSSLFHLGLATPASTVVQISCAESGTCGAPTG